ncbi:ATP-binding cassette domain-containing protein [Dysosmobacter sp. NSJ-60]|uniref:ABC-F family ATP-binding cassette domain-containing protein n=1 Tax=Pusillibacter faecalis TaxID=2714358 RepID=UPI00164E6E35|nr:ATP-binding cassette domain-containing protein [Pusillibacter faecalis]MBC5746793.1 ATP-binding cassette domain-containing protein [Dysosmobacter hominis]MCQ5025584.1 ATP-binding cassette domain-containing protein [Oscillibacter valericigenes]
MITVNDVSMNFSGQTLFKHVDLKFIPGNCYGIIGANGAGKSTFLRILSGDLEPTTGEVIIPKEERMSILKQDHFQYDAYTVLDTVILGNQHLYDIMKEKDALYEKEDFTDEDGVRASELEAEFAEMGGWEAESDASRLLQGLGLPGDILYSEMSSLTAKEKVKVLLAQALFGKPDIILLDEPTNHLDIQAIEWLEDFLLDCEALTLVVSHDRHFLNTVCTNIVDVDYGQIKMYVGNYEFWYESSQLVQRMIKDQNRKNEEKIKELQSFIQRFSANKSKSKQATARRKLLDKLTVEEMPASSRRYPFVGFKMDRECGKEILAVENLSKTVDGRKVLDNVSFRVNRGEKIAFVGEDEIAKTTLFKIVMGEMEPDEGTYKWGTTITTSYFPLDNSAFFNDCDLNLVDWLGQYTADNAEENTESFKRSFLGRMLFSGDDVFKPVKVLSGGEKVRCMLSRMMLFGSNVLVMDQPTNHLDLESITAVNNGLIDFKGVVLFSSHDHEFVQTIANRIMEFHDGKLTDKLGTYEEYLESQRASGAV